MSELLDRLQARLKLAGWDVRDRYEGEPDENSVRAARWLLASRWPPAVAVELRLRVLERRSSWYDWDAYLTAAAVRYPQADADAPPEFEATLVGDEVTRHDHRVLLRVLRWFRDPLSDDFWQEPLAEGEWQPPIEWITRRWGAHAGLEPRWPVCGDGQEMLRYTPCKVSDRRLRLIACGCCRLLPAMRDERNVEAVEAAERYADEERPRREMKKACRHSDLGWLAQLEPLPLALQAIRLAGEARAAKAAADVVRELIGNPFRPVPLRREWLRNEGAVVAHLAESIAIERRYQDMPILGDALEDAGCGAAAVLEHCRGGGPHLRGCWVLDLLRGRG